ncbi:FAD/FMN-containing dehydrogenase [Cenarchaeum symbiosum A]|uniref:D-lactate dehydrogenase (cytochrome) n=1 Tax=Cenarchaeum symbiosum (strain A) TaxID=414004 RepID=A0RYK2_CENSY|nr:FAD/FMN-containing dehydrogenase [Cenarchaeum symbiosum A]
MSPRGLARLPGAVVEGEALDAYSADSGPCRVRPLAVVMPRDAADVARTVRFARRSRIGVTPRGGGTGLAGGAVGGGIVMDMRRMAGVRCGRSSVTAGPGASKGRLDAMLARRGRILGPNPSVGPYCTVGGMLATNAAGSRSLRYGTMIDSVLAVEFVDGTGRLRRLPGDGALSARILGVARRTDSAAFPCTSKNSSGYRLDAVRGAADSARILAGSEGTLGVITSVRLRTHEAPRRRRLEVLAYRSILRAAADCAGLAAAGPSTLEIIDYNILRYIGRPVPAGTRCLLMVETCGAPARGHRGAVVASTRSGPEIDRWWRQRDRSLSYSIRAAPGGGMHNIMEDAAVPVARLPELVRAIWKVCAGSGMRPIIYGHAGDGNLHLRLAGRGGTAGMARRYFAAVRSLGGTMTAEHGDGTARAGYLRAQYGAGTVARFAELKALLDPYGVLNPGKVLPLRAA